MRSYSLSYPPSIPVNTHELIVFDTILSPGIHHTHELAKIAKKHDFTEITRLEFPSAIFVLSSF